MPGLDLAGAAIRLSPATQILGIAEGIETALAAAQIFDVPVWSCLNAQGIRDFQPPADIAELIVFADHDENYVGQAAAYDLARRLALAGKKVSVQIPQEPGDWLDVLTAQNARGGPEMAEAIRRRTQPATSEP
jgi:putative DNA primase/helicase